MTGILTSLLVFALVATGSPGGATALATTSGAQFGYARSLPMIAGIAVSLAVLVAVSAAGLASALLTAPALTLAVKTVGTLYLLGLALRIARAGPPLSGGASQAHPLTFFNGVLLLAVNPKAWAMGMGVATSYTETSAEPLVFAGVLAGIFATAACISLSFWALAGRIMATVLKTARHWSLFNATMAVLLAASVLQLWI